MPEEREEILTKYGTDGENAESDISRHNRNLKRKMQKKREILRVNPYIGKTPREIPKIIHQIWLDKNGEDEQVPERYEYLIEKLKSTNPDYEYKLWKNSDVDRLLEQPQYEKYSDAYHDLRFVISKVDFARMVILHHYGGFYVDLDFEFLRPLRELINQHEDKEIILARESDYYEDRYRKLYDGFLGCVPQHPFILGYVEEMWKIIKSLSRYPISDVKGTTGSVNFYRYANGYDYQEKPLKGYPKWQWKKWLIPSCLVLPQNSHPEDICEPSPFLRQVEQLKTGWELTMYCELLVYYTLFYFLLFFVIALVVILIFGWGKGMDL